MIPIVIVHAGNSYYLKDTLTHAKKCSDRVVLLGDESNFGVIDGIEHFSLTSLRCPELDEFENNFVNYSTNSEYIEKFCFSRVFYLRTWMKMSGTPTCVYIDSDVVLLDNVNNLFNGELAYLYTVGTFSASIHTSCITIDFTNEFIQLCKDIYVNKTKHHLIEDKIRNHVENNIPGGICDMTLHAILSRTLKVNNLNSFINGESTFNDNINDSYGPNGRNTFKMTGSLIEITREGTRFYVYTNDGKKIRLNSIHFQGQAKNLIYPFIKSV